MTNPNFPSDGQGERVDAVVSAANAATYKLGIAPFTPTGGTTQAAWAGSASHSAGTAIGTNDGIMVVGGSGPTGLAVAASIDPGGGLQVANYSQAPSGLTLTATSGTLGAATYYYRVSATTAAGETIPCVEKSLSVGASSGIIVSWQQEPGATGYRVYGRATGAELFIAAVTSGATTSYTDTGSITPAGAMPTVNTAMIGFGTMTATGPAASGATVTGNPVLVAGQDGTNARTLFVDTTGRQVVVGASAVAAAVAGNPVLVGGSDGTNARYILLDTSGRPNVVGAVAVGVAVAGNPVLVGGSDGTNARYLATDTTGRLNVVGTAAVGAAVAGNPVLAGGSDGTNARYNLVDTSGRQVVVGGAASGSAVAGSPVLIAGSDGTNARTLATNSSGHLDVTSTQSTRATYVASATVTTSGAGQIMVIEAPSASIVYISRIMIFQTGTTNSMQTFNLIRTTTAGTGGAITPNPWDTTDSAYGGIVRTNPTTGGTAGVTLMTFNADTVTAGQTAPYVVLDFDGPHARKMPQIAAGTANGIAVSAGAAVTGVSVTIEFLV